MNEEYTDRFEKYDGLWLAIDRDSESVIGKGATSEEALEQARENGFKGAQVTFVSRLFPSFVELCGE